MITWTDQYNHPSNPEEQKLYDHLLHWVQTESPNRLIERFRTLFIDGIGYHDREIMAAIDKIATSKLAEQQFPFFLNRCCHILVNRWQMHPQTQAAIPELLELFDTDPVVPRVRSVRSRTVKRLHNLVKSFKESEQYITLYRLAQVLSHTREGSDDPGEKPLGTLIRRYPYLYEHCLLSEDSTYEQQQAIRQIQAERQHQFEVDLSKYVTYQVRRSQLVRSGASSRSTGRVLHPMDNPTLLTDRELYTSLKHFLGKVEGPYTYRDVAQRFLNHSRDIRSFGAFKDDLYEYLTASIDPGYGKRQFNQRLYTQLQNTLPDSESQKLSDFLVIRTCSQVLNFLVVENSQRPQHFVFIDMMTNLGAAATTGILLKIVLICRKVRPYMEKRFTILFNHYESYSREAVQWLIQSLENLNIAFSIHFGAADLSCFKQIS